MFFSLPTWVVALVLVAFIGGATAAGFALGRYLRKHQEVLREPFEKFYAAQGVSPAGDVVRAIDTLGNARFVRNVIEAAQLHRSQRLVSEFALADVDLTDPAVGADIGNDSLEVLTAADLAEGLAAALPRDFRY